MKTYLAEHNAEGEEYSLLCMNIPLEEMLSMQKNEYYDRGSHLGRFRVSPKNAVHYVWKFDQKKFFIAGGIQTNISENMG